MNKYIKHFITITKHKYYVALFCFKCGYYKRGLLHDLSKYSPTEFLASAKYFQGTRSPIDEEKEHKGYSIAWQHHKGHNPHHWEYWIYNLDTYKNTPCKMPYEYVIEMLCDWISAGIVYSNVVPNFDKPYKQPYEYNEAHKKERIFHEETQKLVDFYLDIIRYEGINYFCKRIKRTKKFMSRGYNNL